MRGEYRLNASTANVARRSVPHTRALVCCCAVYFVPPISRDLWRDGMESAALDPVCATIVQKNGERRRKQHSESLCLQNERSGAPGEIRTPDPLVRSHGGGKSKCFRVRRLRVSSPYPTLFECP
jgi:hypothetical protein